MTQSSNFMSTDVTLVKPRSCSDLVASAQRPPVAQYSVIFAFMSVLSGKPTSFQMRNSISPRGTLTAPGTYPSANSFSLRTSTMSPRSLRSNAALKSAILIVLTCALVAATIWLIVGGYDGAGAAAGATGAVCAAASVTTPASINAVNRVDFRVDMSGSVASGEARLRANGAMVAARGAVTGVAMLRCCRPARQV